MAGLLFSAPHKSAGKTTLVQGIAAALKQRGVAVQTFKKGPDYIDPMWLAAASGRPCYNLDFNTMERGEIADRFHHYATSADIALIEGNMGLFDSIDVEGKASNAELAKQLQLPVVLIVDVQGATRSIAPLIQGFQQFDSDLNIAAVILNNCGGSRHEQRLRQVMNRYLSIPVIGVVQRNPLLHIEERHLGLIPSNEAVVSAEREREIAAVMADQIDLDQLLELGATAPPPVNSALTPTIPRHRISPTLRIAIARDEAFGFYYAADLERLEAM
ncbi:MAG: cobyrinate a,c-diamide synthase, partial [Gammaproteobacteria bacterium]|nr:cobyrinate a,c-diamide synthase [Gammaproteobacteria bacterium]